MPSGALYWYGNERESFVVGFTVKGEIEPVFEEKTNYLYLYMQGSTTEASTTTDDCAINIVTDKKINVSSYSKVSMCSYNKWDSVARTVLLSLSDDKTTNGTLDTILKRTEEKTGLGVFSLDISSASGEYYVKHFVRAYKGDHIEYIYALWLE